MEDPKPEHPSKSDPEPKGPETKTPPRSIDDVDAEYYWHLDDYEDD